jgi:hypothetical protein
MNSPTLSRRTSAAIPCFRCVCFLVIWSLVEKFHVSQCTELRKVKQIFFCSHQPELLNFIPAQKLLFSAKFYPMQGAPYALSVLLHLTLPQR